MAENITPRIILSADSFEDDAVLCDLLTDEDLALYIKGVKFSRHLLRDHHASEHVLHVCIRQPGFGVFADLQLAGGYEDMAAQLDDKLRLHRPSAVTIAPGTPDDGISYIQDSLRDNDRAPDIFLTGALPENSPNGILRTFKRLPDDFTTEQANLAADIKIKGIYAAAVYARRFKGIEYIGAGISDIPDYLTPHGVHKVAAKVGAAVVLGCDAVVVGHSIADADDQKMALHAMGEEIIRAEKENVLNGQSH